MMSTVFEGYSKTCSRKTSIADQEHKESRTRMEASSLLLEIIKILVYVEGKHMKATATNLLKFLQGTKQFVIPIYQRTYGWRISDCQQLWNDVLRVAQDEKISAHFLGSIVYVEKGIYHISSITQLLVIDGQQRLTTLSLLLIALSEALDESGNKGSVEITRKKICNYYLFNAEESGDAHYKLLLTHSDKETLTYLLEGGEEPSPVSARIEENYQFFRDQIRQSGIDPVTLY